MKHFALAALIVGWLGPGCPWASAAPTEPPPAAPSPAQPSQGDSVFTSAPPLRIRIEVAAADVRSLRLNPRQYVRATLRERNLVCPEIGLHLKGRTGSFRSIDDKPSLTLDFGKLRPGLTFHGLTKIHLNNSVEDPSYLNEYLGTELFRAAALPAPRVTHALVELNGRHLGLYVLKEGFTPEFLGRFFPHTEGNLYEHESVSPPGAGSLRRSSGSETSNDADAESLLQAGLEPDLTRRWARLQSRLDARQFLSFVAIEVMGGHRDGYSLAANNYRIYHDPGADRFVFLPHGMDQLFGAPDLPLHPHLAGPIARAMLEIPAARRLYREQFAALFTNAFQIERLTRAADKRMALLAQALPGAAGRVLRKEAALVKHRMIRRAASLARQLGEPPPTPLRFENNIALLHHWRPVDHPAPAPAGEDTAPARPSTLRLRAGQVASLSWRTAVWLPAGRYRFEGRARTKGVVPLRHGRNHGAGLRVSGIQSPMPHQLAGDSSWTPLGLDFAVAREVEVELICELRAGSGEAWFDRGSLRLLRLE